MSPEEVLSRLGFGAGPSPAPTAKYQVVVVTQGWAHVSGCLPIGGDGTLSYSGKLGTEHQVEAGRAAARICAGNLLRAVGNEVGGLSRVERLVKVMGYVNCEPDFSDVHLVMNGASELFLEVLGEAGRHARSAVGVNSLPLGASVEVDAIVRLKKETSH